MRPNSGTIKKAADNIINKDNKGLMLMRDINTLPGNGLWCTKIEKKRSDMIILNKSKPNENTSSPNEDIELETNKKIISQLKLKVQDLTSKLQVAMARAADAEYRANRIESNKQNYIELYETRTEENKGLQGKLDSLENTVINLNEALSNAKKEILRMKNQIEAETENTKKQSQMYQSLLIEKERKDAAHLNDTKTLMKKLNQIIQEKENLTKLLRMQSKDNEFDYANNIQKIAEEKENSLRMMETHIAKLSTENTEIKRKLQNEESLKVKLNDIIKKKKEKISILKEQLKSYKEAILTNNNEVKWNQELVNQRDNQIKVLKERIKKLEEDEVKSNKEIERLKKKFSEAKKSDITEGDIHLKVIPKPFLFGPEND